MSMIDEKTSFLTFKGLIEVVSRLGLLGYLFHEIISSLSFKAKDEDHIGLFWL